MISEMEYWTLLQLTPAQNWGRSKQEPPVQLQTVPNANFFLNIYGITVMLQLEKKKKKSFLAVGWKGYGWKDG